MKPSALAGVHDYAGYWPATVAAAIGIAITLWLFYPGWLSIDSATHYQQALTGQYDNVHPPLLAWLWRQTDALWPGPAGLYLPLTAIWWTALALITGRWLPGWRGMLAALAIGLMPPVLLIAAHLWKDVALSAALLVATAAIAAQRSRGHWASLAVALLALMAAVALRHNAWPAALPLLLWLAWPRGVDKAWRARRVGATLALALVLALTPALIGRALGAADRQPWSAVLLWDLAAVSVASGRVLIPPQVSAADLSVDDLAAGYVSWANPPMFVGDKIRLGFFTPYSDADRRAVIGAWLAMLREHPRAYLAHRWRVTRYLLFGPPPHAPRELVYVAARILPPQARITLAPLDRARDRAILRVAEALRGTPLFAGATWLALALIAALLAWRRRHSEAGRAALALSASAWAYAAPLALITGSAEFRYLHWTVIAALLAALAAIAARRAPSGHNQSP